MEFATAKSPDLIKMDQHARQPEAQMSEPAGLHQQCKRQAQHLKGVHAMTAAEQLLIEKIKQLPPRRMAEVEDFVDFLHAREDDHRLTHAATKASEASVAQVWDNDEDAAYDRL
jgi:hypothetical protein